MDNTSLEAIVAQLDAPCDKFPKQALQEAQRRGSEMAPHLISLLKKATAAVQAGQTPNTNGHLFALYLLTEQRAKEALPTIVEAVSLPDEGPFDLFGDSITEDLNRILAVLAADQPEVIDALISDPSINEYVRRQAAKTYMHWVREGRWTRAEAVGRLRSHLITATQREDHEGATGVAAELVSYAPQECCGEIEAAFRRDLVDRMVVNEKTFARSITEGESWFRQELQNLPPTGIPDTVAELETWACFRKSDQPAIAPGLWQPPRAIPGARVSSFKHLRNQVIDEQGPGTVLHDFEALLEFIGLDGVRSTGKNHLLPMSRLFELDERLAKPLHPRMKRPQQQSFPHIHGLYLLLRATELGVPEGQGKKTGRLKLDPAVLASWRALNATERYFTLLEAWLRHASWEAVGGRGSGWASDLALAAHNLWYGVPATGEVFVKNQPQTFVCHGVQSYCTLALFELFGLFHVYRREPAQGENWRIERVDRTAFGDELLTLVFPEIKREIYGKAPDLPAFGAWQPQLQSYFPEWQNNLELPEPEFRNGTYLFKVSLGRVWRRIAVPAHTDLESLAQEIIGAYHFDGDHLHRFALQNRDGTRLAIAHPFEDEEEWHTEEFQVGYLPLSERQSMAFVYDYGAHWEFDVKLEKVDPPSDAITQATVVESHGQPPAEYGDPDDNDW